MFLLREKEDTYQMERDIFNRICFKKIIRMSGTVLSTKHMSHYIMTSCIHAIEVTWTIHNVLIHHHVNKIFIDKNLLFLYF